MPGNGEIGGKKVAGCVEFNLRRQGGSAFSLRDNISNREPRLRGPNYAYRSPASKHGPTSACSRLRREISSAQLRTAGRRSLALENCSTCTPWRGR